MSTGAGRDDPAGPDGIAAAVDAERQNLAQLLHDTLSQSLNAARIYARVTRDQVTRTSSAGAPSIGELERVLQACVDELQQVTRWLRPAELHAGGLSACLRELTELASRKVPCEFDAVETTVDASATLQAELLRIAQLALHDLVQAGDIRGICLRLDLDERSLILEVRASCERPPVSPRRALLSQRARALGGSCSVDHEPGTGTALKCRLPRHR